MKSKKTDKEFSRLQPWRAVVRHKDTLQELTVIAFGQASSVAIAHLLKAMNSSFGEDFADKFEMVDIFPITSADCVALALFCEKYANPLITRTYAD